MHPPERATGKDIILDIVENMRAYQEELLYSSIVPTSFEVHLHASDYDRLEAIFPAIVAEARRALDEELIRQNRRRAPAWLRTLTNARGPAQAARTEWTIALFRDENGDVRPGEVLVDSQLALPATPELGTASRTRRITTSRIGQHTTTTTEILDVPASSLVGQSTPSSELPPTPRQPTEPVAPPVHPPRAVPSMTHRAHERRPYASLTFEDKSGRHTHPITESQLVIGRGGAGYWVDLRIDAAPDVSREHVRLRRDASTGQFFLKDLSLYGTTVNGQPVSSNEPSGEGKRRDPIEVPLPAVARIGLADIVFLDFRASDAGDVS